jgi:hypothetical protein
MIQNMPSPVQQGVICGVDALQEWLLPWWWERYSACNAFPVTFFDFGMTEEARQWCGIRGDVRSLEKIKVASFCGHPDMAKLWESHYGSSLEHQRTVWFCKPRAMVQSPYQRTLWLDMDCEVLQPLDPLFSLPLGPAQASLARGFLCDDLPCFHEAVYYHSGVVLFEKGSLLIKKWVEAATAHNAQHIGDDVLVSELIRREKIPVFDLPHEYNWTLVGGFNLNVAIVHWVRSTGKKYIREKGGFKPILEEFHRICREMDAARLGQ